MNSVEQENFLRVAIVIVDHGKESLIELLDLHLSITNQTFEQFINLNQHEIFYLFNNSRCCKCPHGYIQRRSRIIYEQQMSILFDKATQCNSGRCRDFCCCLAKSGLSPKNVDMTLAKCLLIHFCSEIFWYSSLSHQNLTFEQFLNRNKHGIYHLWQNGTSCCECDPSSSTQVRKGYLNTGQWNNMFITSSVPCKNHRKRPAFGHPNCICVMKSKPGITLNQTDDDTKNVLIQHFCPARLSVDSLVSIRNEHYGHISEGRISNTDYHALMTEIEQGIVAIATVCNKEMEFRDRIELTKTKHLDCNLYERYKLKISDVFSQNHEIHKVCNV